METDLVVEKELRVLHLDLKAVRRSLCFSGSEEKTLPQWAEPEHKSTQSPPTQ